MSTTALAPAALTAQDRCDRCCARAYVRVTLHGGGELMFCAHHGRQHQDAIRSRAKEIQDNSHVLRESVSATAPDGER